MGVKDPICAEENGDQDDIRNQAVKDSIRFFAVCIFEQGIRILIGGDDFSFFFRERDKDYKCVFLISILIGNLISSYQSKLIFEISETIGILIESFSFRSFKREVF